ncbi:MAG: hypothetical protein LBN02_02145 [Oscillospiraceae bacterium]|jgi:hypothetical protein|nr:hypothetical protein [Oscillospiraceae bacterium]
MSTAVVYYSFTNHTREYAKTLAAQLDAPLIELAPPKPLSKLGAYLRGCPAAIGGKSWKTAAEPDFAAYDKLIFCSPIWASNVPPYVNYALGLLPEGKHVEFRLVSAGGKSNCAERLTATVAARGCVVDGIEDIQG